jgi:sec-independent protein translocase protein TatB
MFDVGFDEMLVIAVVAIVVIGPKDLPMALRAAGRWIAKVRKVSGHFRSGVETMIREAELEEMEKKWAAQNAAIMNADPHPQPQMEPLAETDSAVAPDSAEAALEAPQPPLEGPPARKKPAAKAKKVARDAAPAPEPTLPFPLP